MKNRAKGTKYMRISKQQKYIFLKQAVERGHSISQVFYVKIQSAAEAGIHYSSGKTILCFYRKQHKQYRDYQVSKNIKNMIQASYIHINPHQQSAKIQVFSTISKDFNRRIFKNNNNVLPIFSPASDQHLLQILSQNLQNNSSQNRQHISQSQS